MAEESCQMPDTNPSPDEIREILDTSRTVAVVGLSTDPSRDSHRVARYLKDHGYKVIPVNPQAADILGEKSYASVREIPEPVDVVDVFRKPEAIPAVVDDAITAHVKVVWMQLGLAHPEAAAKARGAGLTVVQSRCMKMEHEKIAGTGGGAGS